MRLRLRQIVGSEDSVGAGESDNAEEASSPSDGGGVDDAEEASSPSDAPSAASASNHRSWWQEHKGSIAAALAVAVVAGWVSPVGHWIGGAADHLRDQLRSFDGQRLDSLKERIETRPFWKGEPQLLDKSLEVVRRDEEIVREPFESVATIDGVKARVLLPDRLLSDG